MQLLTEASTDSNVSGRKEGIDYTMEKTRGLISHIQTYCTKDGPGIRTTAFFMGCNLRCKWCANPEAMLLGEKLFYHENLCKGCGRCVTHFPQQLAYENGKINIIGDRELMKDELPELCNYQAYEKKGRYYTPQELANELKKDQVFFKQSGGGVTFSGGEPFLQPGMLLETMKLLREDGIHIAIETAGLFDFEKQEEIIELCDLFLYDVKAYSREIHEKCTEVSNQKILENLKKLNEKNKDICTRMIIVPQYNDDVEDIKERLDYIVGFECVQQVDFLKYHNLGEGKYHCLGMEYPLENLGYDELQLDKTMLEIEEYAKLKGIKYTIGG